jgi:oxygen-independent coproporphyrinogen III oxidase
MTHYLYIHIPFCVRKCSYCDFFSVPFDADVMREFTHALCKELKLKKQSAVELDSVYIGGGTPSLLAEECICELFRCLKENYRFTSSTEITVEANPGTLDTGKLKLLHSLGVNRLSVGVQSFNEAELKILGRVHDAATAKVSLAAAKDAGFENIGLDLMYGIPGQTLESWGNSLAEAVASSPAHISAYELTLGEKTPLHEAVSNSKLRMPDEELVLKMHHAAVRYLTSKGYEHYEISNFARPGYACRHNLNYWNRGEYIGAGPSAHSFTSGQRYSNVEDAGLYIQRLSADTLPETERAMVSIEDARKEFLFLGLRKCEGVELRRAREWGIDLCRDLQELTEEGLLEKTLGNLRFTTQGRAISNSVLVRLFDIAGL